MKILHTADLHFGKSMNEVTLVEADQRFWKDRFMEQVRETGADAVVIAGDVYDRSNPSNEAVELFDEMVCGLADMDIPVLIAAGNHDSGQKLGFAGDILSKGGVHIAGVPTAEIKHVTLTDEYGPVTFWLVPYVFPQAVSSLLGCEPFRDYDSAFRALIAAQDIDFTQRNVIVSHQNITREGKEAERSGSESMVGGVGGIEYTVFDGFEYAALGHIHRAQYVGRKEVRYAGSPLCYHFDEAKFPDKGAVLIEIKAKGESPDITPILIEPLHKVRIIRDTYDGICAELMKDGSRSEYIRAELTDRHPDPEMCSTLRSIAELHGSIMMEIVPVGKADVNGNVGQTCSSEKKSLQEYFSDLYAMMNESARPDEASEELLDVLAAALEAADMDEKNIEQRLADRLINAALFQEVTK